MNVVNQLTLRQLKLNKKRTLVTLIGVIISVAMITAVSTLGTSFVDLFKRHTMNGTGNWHVRYDNATSAQLNAIQADPATKMLLISRDLGYAPITGTVKNPDKPYWFVSEYNEGAYRNFPINLLEGRLPTASDELVIPEHAVNNGGQSYRVGEKLTLAIGSREMIRHGETEDSTSGSESSKEEAAKVTPKETPKDTTNDQTETTMVNSAEGGDFLTQETPLQRDVEGEANERIHPEKTRTYTIVGVMARSSFEPIWAPGYTALSYVDESLLKPGETATASVEVKKVTRGIYKHANELGKELGIQSVDFNHSLLRYYGVVKLNRYRMTLYSVIAIIMAIIMIGSISLIYNAFAISVSERSRHLGMLSSVGATRRQKSRSVFFEGTVIGLISIPIGIAAGLGGIALTISIINQLILDALAIDEKIRFVVSPYSLLLAVLLSVITIFVSTYIPARRAARVSPMDAIRQSQDVRMTGRVVKTSKLTRRLFGFEAEIGLKNLKRNRRRYRTTVISLMISLILFLSVSTFTFYLNKAVDMSQRSYNYDLQITSSQTTSILSTSTGVTKADNKHILVNEEKSSIRKMLGQIARLDKVTEASLLDSMLFTYGATKEQAADYLVEDNRKRGLPDKGPYPYRVELIGLSDDAFARYAREVGVSPERFADPDHPAGIVIDEVKYRNVGTGEFVQTKAIHLTEGTVLSLTDSSSDTAEQKSSGSLEVAATTGKVPMGVRNYEWEPKISVIVPKSTWNAIVSQRSDFYTIAPKLFLKSDDPDGLETQIEKWRTESGQDQLIVWNIHQEERRSQRMVQMVSIFIYGFVTLITAIAIANIFNTISTSIALRKREFAMLRSVGMTPKGFNKMIRYESLFYGIKTLAYGLPISFGIMLLLHRALYETFLFRFAVPWGSVAAAVCAVFLIVGAAMLYSSAKIRKGNILDGLRTETI
ncbi:ABC transporter permease [Gorillibacterium timonense]|uniref:ABC transporter permease n=1 Tax=Gorillibacterium timonense TaxID=1689269 RepID=UPI00071CC722|nr:ABC transporter permease [Gorillibacterium timonense]